MTHQTNGTNRSGGGPRIRPATPVDLEPLAHTLATAFAATPDAAWVIPDPTDRNRIYPAIAALRLAPAIDAGWVHTTDDHTAAAVWQPPHTSPDPGTPDPAEPDPDTQWLPNAITGPHQDRLHTLTCLLTQARPAKPHHHLHYLAVHPDHQRQGLGTALLRHHHTRLDTHGEPAALTAVSPESRDLYLHHGYTTTATVHLPDGPPLWTMWRPPHPAAPSQSPPTDAWR